MKVPKGSKGKTYTNGKGSFREILEEGDFPAYSGQSDRDCIKYSAWRLRTRKSGEVVDSGRTVGVCTRVSFQAWAKREVF